MCAGMPNLRVLAVSHDEIGGARHTLGLYRRAGRLLCAAAREVSHCVARGVDPDHLRDLDVLLALGATRDPARATASETNAAAPAVTTAPKAAPVVPEAARTTSCVIVDDAPPTEVPASGASPAAATAGTAELAWTADAEMSNT